MQVVGQFDLARGKNVSNSPLNPNFTGLYLSLTTLRQTHIVATLSRQSFTALSLPQDYCTRVPSGERGHIYGLVQHRSKQWCLCSGTNSSGHRKKGKKH